MTLKELYAAWKLKTLKLSELLKKGDELTEAEVTEAEALNTEIDALEPKMEAAKRLEAVHKGLSARTALIEGLDIAGAGGTVVAPPVGGLKNGDNPNEDGDDTDDGTGSVFATAHTTNKSTQYKTALKSGKVPAYAKQAKVRNLPDGEIAFRMGMFFLASLFADPG